MYESDSMNLLYVVFFSICFNICWVLTPFLPSKINNPQLTPPPKFLIVSCVEKCEENSFSFLK